MRAGTRGEDSDVVGECFFVLDSSAAVKQHHKIPKADPDEMKKLRLLSKEDVGERLHHADARRYTFQSSVGEHLSSLSLLRKHHGKNETGRADLVTGRSAVPLA
jgi:hypothetical protein